MVDKNTYLKITFAEYKILIDDMLENESILSMNNFIQHQNISTLEHSIYVSYTSYRICRILNWNTLAVARGALMHDFFLYDWHIPSEKKLKLKELHGFTHPSIALKNASMHFEIDDIESDIILKHMWPLTRNLPKYKESFLVMLVDKYCSIREILDHRSHFFIRSLTAEALA